MTNRFYEIEHKGKIILYFDYRGLTSKEEDLFLDTITQATEYFKTKSPHQLVLLDVNNSYTNNKIMWHWKNVAKETQHLADKIAMIGVDMVKSILVEGVNFFAKTDIKTFRTKEQALNWLVE